MAAAFSSAEGQGPRGGRVGASGVNVDRLDETIRKWSPKRPLKRGSSWSTPGRWIGGPPLDWTMILVVALVLVLYVVFFIAGRR